MTESDQNSQPEQESVLLSALDPVTRWGPLLAVALVVLYRPMASGLVGEVGPLSTFTLVLLIGVFLWLCGGVLRERLHWHAGLGGSALAAFLIWMAVCSYMGHHPFASARVWTLFAGYALVALLVLHAADTRLRRVFLLSCLLATGAALAAYAIFHRAFYIPALQRWVEQDPQYFRSAFDIRGRMFGDLLQRVQTGRAYGNFITPNQLASFLLIVLFPLAGGALGLWSRRTVTERAGRYGRVVLAAGTLLVLVALVLSGSKGGLVGAVFGVGVLVLGPGWRWARRHAWKLAAGAAVALVLFLAGQAADVVPGRRRFGASLGVRVDYWKVSARMARDHPVTGVGPGCWEEHYTRRKKPEYEETRLAHNAYLQVWSETGTIGLVLLALAVGAPAVLVLRRLIRAETTEPEPEEDRDTFRHLRRAGLILAVAALAVDYFFVGTFRPPRTGGPRLLTAIPWLPYLGVVGVWAGVFHFVFGGIRTWPGRRYLLWGLVAGLGAFAVHSTAEFTLRIPALGTSVFAIGALLVSEVSVPRLGKRVPHAPAVALLLVSFVVTFGWATWLVPRCLDYSLKKAQIFSARGEMSEARNPLEKRMEIIGFYRQALANLPWDDRLWQELATQQITLARQLEHVAVGVQMPPETPTPAALLEEALQASRRAIRLNTQKAEHYRTAGRLLVELGRPEQGAALLRHSAELHPSIPESWLVFARAAEQVEGLSDRVCQAYRKAAERNVRELEGGRVVRGQYHERNLLSAEQGQMVARKVGECADKVE